MKTVPLSGAKAAGRVALVNDADYKLVSQYRWFVMERKIEGQRTRGPYAGAWIRHDGRRVLLLMHKLITGWPLTDHKNHDGLDNRRRNLRNATKAQNNQNSRSRLGSSSQYKGVHWSTRQQRWRANIAHEGRVRSLGVFMSEEDAARAYDAAALQLYGEYAVLNFPQVNGRPARRSNGSYDAHRDRIRSRIRLLTEAIPAKPPASAR